MEQVKQFMAKLQHDESIKAHYDKLSENKADFGELIALAKENGFIFTEDDWINSLRLEQSVRTELSEKELESVSGGVVPSGWPDVEGCSFKENTANPTRTTRGWGGEIYVRRCYYYADWFKCRSGLCACYGSHRCTEGLHYTYADGTPSSNTVFESHDMPV